MKNSLLHLNGPGSCRAHSESSVRGSWQPQPFRDAHDPTLACLCPLLGLWQRGHTGFPSSGGSTGPSSIITFETGGSPRPSRCLIAVCLACSKDMSSENRAGSLEIICF